MAATRPLLTVAILTGPAPGAPRSSAEDDRPFALVVEGPFDLQSSVRALADGGAEADGLPAPVVVLAIRADGGRLLRGGDGAEVRSVVEELLADRELLRQAWAAAHRLPPFPDAGRDGGDGAPPAEGDSQPDAAGLPELAEVVEPEPPLPPAEAAFLTRVGEALDAHLSDTSFGVAELAAAVGLSPRQFRRKVDALAGESASRMVRRVRVERAAVLLADGVLSVKEVRYAVGFASASGFRRAFREVLGVSPSACTRERGEGA